jgi:dihydroorotate dehydrogenase
LRQTDATMRAACEAILATLKAANTRVPLWVKISPGLRDEQYRMMLRAFTEVGVRAIITTNTLGSPIPAMAGVIGGIGGRRLHGHAIRATAVLAAHKRAIGSSIDLIGSGGIHDLRSYQAFAAHGVRAAQYWSAIVFRGPLAAALILDEIERARPGVPVWEQ